MGMKILITGAAGFVANALVESILRDSYMEWSLILCDQAFPAQIPLENVNYQNCDITDYSSLKELFSEHNFDAVVHLAAVLSKGETNESARLIERVNIAGTMNMALLSSEFHAKLIFFSTGLVYGNDKKCPFGEEMPCAPAGYYDLSKYIGEEIIRHQNLTASMSYTIFRPSVIYGPEQHGSMFIPSLMASAVKGEPYAMTKGEQTRDFVYIDDVVSALRLSIAKPLSGTFNLSCNFSASIASIADLVAKWSGSVMNKGAIPYRNHETWDYRLDNAKLVSQGWNPQISLEKGLSKCFETYKKGV